MKTPIEWPSIRKGDLIRCESTDGVLLGDEFVATEFYVTDADLAGLPSEGTSYYLLDRPAPPVSLPETPTLGWIEHWDGRRVAGVFRRALDVAEYEHPAVRGFDADREWDSNCWYRVTAFTTATAVPTDALETLRAEESRIYHTATDWINRSNDRRAAIETFLAAVDAAGSGDE